MPIVAPYTPTAVPRSRPGDGEHYRPADALDGAGDVEEGRIGRKTRSQRGDREDRQPGGEHAPAAEPVGEHAGGQHECGERQRVRVDHPLEVGEACAEVVADRRQRGVHHRDVEQQHERRDADREQRPPLAVHIYVSYGVRLHCELQFVR
jgi:hypothetical protein